MGCTIRLMFDVSQTVYAETQASAYWAEVYAEAKTDCKKHK